MALFLICCSLSLLSACPEETATGEGDAPLLDIRTLLASPDYAERPVRLQGRIVIRDAVSSVYYLDEALGYGTLQYCPTGTLVFEDDTGALQFYIEGSVDSDPDYQAFINGFIGKQVEITAVWPDVSGMVTCAAVCVCDPRLSIAGKDDIVVLQ